LAATAALAQIAHIGALAATMPELSAGGLSQINWYLNACERATPSNACI
jgi:hypothetical protein